ncbi:MAG: hypothetical protein GY822_32515 [Deltaproteobacteria bacterium]|nr:hypothetical protein [Deltaproteobacteria bacterium]
MTLVSISARAFRFKPRLHSARILMAAALTFAFGVVTTSTEVQAKHKNRSAKRDCDTAKSALQLAQEQGLKLRAFKKLKREMCRQVHKPKHDRHGQHGLHSRHDDVRDARYDDQAQTTHGAACGDVRRVEVLARNKYRWLEKLRPLEQRMCSQNSPRERRRYGNGQVAFNGNGTWFYENGSLARTSNGAFYFPNGALATSQNGSLYYPNGNLARSSNANLYFPDGQQAFLVNRSSWALPNGTWVSKRDAIDYLCDGQSRSDCRRLKRQPDRFSLLIKLSDARVSPRNQRHHRYSN